MFLNLNNLDISEINSDICILGAGVAGITIAREFINTKTNVVVLESGSLDPESEAQSLTAGKNKGFPYYDLEETRDRAFGGTSNSWRVKHDENKKGKFVRLHDLDGLDFKKRDWVPYSGWPFSKSELIPYYKRAQKVFKIGPYRYDADFWADNSNESKIPFKDSRVRTTIFQFGNKDVFLSDYKQELHRAENIKVYLNATALKLNINEYANNIKSIIASSLSGKETKVHSACFILAMGGLENPRIMLLSDDSVKNGIGNQNDLVGRFFMEHPHLWNGVFYPSKISFFDNSDLYKIHFCKDTPVLGELALSEEVLREHGILNTVASLHFSARERYRKPLLALHDILESSQQGLNKKLLIKNLKSILSNPDSVLHSVFKKITGVDLLSKYDSECRYHGYLLSMMSEQSPNPDSRVTLCREKDRFDQNKIELQWKLNSFDIYSIKKFQEILNRELKKNSLGYLDIDLNYDLIPKKIHGGYHHMGTTRMHVNPQRGVVNEECRVHGIDNLFVAGSSVFPTVGYANPTLTIVALAIRLADHLRKGFDYSKSSMGGNNYSEA